MEIGKEKIKFIPRIELTNENDTKCVWDLGFHKSKKEALKIIKRENQCIKNGKWDNVISKKDKIEGYHLNPVVVSCTITEDGEICDFLDWYDIKGNLIN